MLTVTSRQLLDRAVAGDLGQPVVSSPHKDQTVVGALSSVISVPRGQTLLITSVQLQADQGHHNLSTAYQPSPTLQATGFSITNEAGSEVWATVFQSFLRRISNYHTGITPTAISAAPGNTIVWHPKYAIPVPGGFSAKIGVSLGDFGNHGALHGLMVDETTADSLGYNVNAVAATSRHGIVGSRGTASATTIITGRAGKSIRFLDVHMRLQPGSNGTNTLVLQQVDGQKVFQWTNSNAVDNLQEVFSPDEIYLKPGQGLQIQVTTANTCSVNIQYEFVDEAEVPENAWFACVQPAKPTPTTTAVPTGLGNARRTSQIVTVYYPRSGATATVPGVGSQFLVRGVQASVQKGNGTFANSLQTAEMTMFCVSQGAAAGQIGFSLLALAQTNGQITPTLFAGHHDQCISFVDDALNVPCKPNDGSLWIDSINFDADGLTASALGDTTKADADITAWSFSLWGRSIATTFKQSTNRGN